MAKIITDTKNFKIKSIAISKKVKKASVRGMGKAVDTFMDDCIEKVPKCPKRSGAMAASHSTFVNGKLNTVSKAIPSEGGEATPRTVPLIVASKNIEGALVVHKPYAASQHEGTRKEVIYHKYTLPGSGPKWVESKLIRFGKAYFALIAGEIRRT